MHVTSAVLARYLIIRNEFGMSLLSLDVFYFLSSFLMLVDYVHSNPLYPK